MHTEFLSQTTGRLREGRRFYRAYLTRFIAMEPRFKRKSFTICSINVVIDPRPIAYHFGQENITWQQLFKKFARWLFTYERIDVYKTSTVCWMDTPAFCLHFRLHKGPK